MAWIASFLLVNGAYQSITFARADGKGESCVSIQAQASGGVSIVDLMEGDVGARGLLVTECRKSAWERFRYHVGWRPSHEGGCAHCMKC